MNALLLASDETCRPLLPACLQHRAPARYEILDHKQRRLFPSLAGYRLKPGEEYQLRVETQDGSPQGWRLHIAPPPRYIDWPAGDVPRDNARVLSLRTRSYLRDHWFQLFDSSAVELAVGIEFDDGRQPYRFAIPVVLAHRWIYTPLLLGGAVAALVPYSWSWEWRAAVSVSGAVAAAGLCWLADLWRCHRRARRLMSKIEEEAGPFLQYAEGVT